MLDKDLCIAIEKIINFNKNGNLTSKISKIEKELSKKTKSFIPNYINENEIDKEVFKSALILKRNFGQINVIIHFLGIINLLPVILEENEVIEKLSLGAGNAHSDFDLITNKRIAEFKFIDWKGQDTVRENNVFKDFFNLETNNSQKNKYLYVFNKEIVLKFFNSNKSLEKVLTDNKIRQQFFNLYGYKYNTVSDFYKENCNKVKIIDILELSNNFADSNEQNKKTRGYQKDIIEDYIKDQIEDARLNGNAYIDIKAGKVGKDTGFNKSFPNICRIMKNLKKEQDIILHDTPSGMGATVTIRYFIE